MSKAYVVIEPGEGCYECNGEKIMLFVAKTKEGAEAKIKELDAIAAHRNASVIEASEAREQIAIEHPVPPGQPVRPANGDRYMDSQGRDMYSVLYEAWNKEHWLPVQSLRQKLGNEKTREIAAKFGLEVEASHVGTDEEWVWIVGAGGPYEIQEVESD